MVELELTATGADTNTLRFMAAVFDLAFEKFDAHTVQRNWQGHDDDRREVMTIVLPEKD